MISKSLTDNAKEKTIIKQGTHSIVSNISNEVLNGPMRGWLCGHFIQRIQFFIEKI